MCPHGRAHWRYLADITELFVCDGDAALCQITLTTCNKRMLLECHPLSQLREHLTAKNESDSVRQVDIK